LSTDIIRLKHALTHIDLAEYTDAMDLCLEVLAENPENQPALDILFEAARLGNIGAAAFRAILDIVSKMENRVPDKLVLAGREMLINRESRVAWLKGFINSTNLDSSVESDSFDIRAFVRYAFVMDILEEHHKANLIWQTGTVYQQLLATNGEVDLLKQIQTSAPESNEEAGVTGWVNFIAAVHHIRLQKLATAVRSAGLKVRLIFRGEETKAEEYSDLFDEVVHLASPFDLIDVLQDYPAITNHVFFAADHGHMTALVALLLRPENVIFDSYDLALEEMSPLSRLAPDAPAWYWARKNASVQRFLFNHTPAISGRALYAKIHRSRLVGNPFQKRIYCPELAWGREQTRPKMSQSDGQIHAVHGGTFLVENAYGSRWAFFKQLAEKAGDLGFHFHLYPMPWGDGDMRMYAEIAEKSDHFHIHPNLPYDDWLSELQLYDVGLYHIMAEDASLEGDTPRNIDASGTWANKVGDYLDANVYALPPPAAKTMVFITERYGIGECGTLEKVFSKKFWDRLRKELIEQGKDFSQAKETLRMERQGPRLRDFYERVAGIGSE